uniref:Putative crack-3 cq n=1 Tax=Nyssomyia neivai TaxID=330878 RepID=A0A1L8DA31_9DIPT
MVTLCTVCKKRTNTRSDGGEDDSVECVGCKEPTHKKCTKLSDSGLKAVVERRVDYRCSSCKALRRSFSVSEEPPNIIKVNKAIEDLSTFVHDKWAIMEKVLLSIETMSKENLEWRQKVVNVEAKNAQHDEKITQLEERVIDLEAKGDPKVEQLEEKVVGLEIVCDKLQQRELLLTLEVVIPALENHGNPVDFAIDVIGAAIDIALDKKDIASVKITKLGDKNLNVMMLKVANLGVKTKILAGRRAKDKENGNKGIFYQPPEMEPVRIFINEKLTPRRRVLLKAAKDWKKKLNYKYVWIAGGNIMMRKKEGEQPFIINSFTDFLKLT